jgi:hypothetical protein
MCHNAGSNPALGATGRWRNLAARRSLKAEVPGSKPGRPAKFVGASFNGRTAGLHPADEGSIPFASTKVRRRSTN